MFLRRSSYVQKKQQNCNLTAVLSALLHSCTHSQKRKLVNLLDCGSSSASAAWSTAGCSSEVHSFWHTAWHSAFASSGVQFHHYGVAKRLKLLLLLLVLGLICHLVPVEPLEGLGDLRLDFPMYSALI
eukprot:Selendium_serpulae@DN5724_c0_g1_i6.p1